MSESGVAVQKSPRLSSPHLLRRYLNYLSWLDLDTIDHVCLLCRFDPQLIFEISTRLKRI